MIVDAAESLWQQTEPVSSLSLHVYSLGVVSLLKSNSQSWAITPMRKYQFIKYRTYKNLQQLWWHWAEYHSRNMKGLFKYWIVKKYSLNYLWCHEYHHRHNNKRKLTYIFCDHGNVLHFHNITIAKYIIISLRFYSSKF